MFIHRRRRRRRRRRWCPRSSVLDAGLEDFWIVDVLVIDVVLMVFNKRRMQRRVRRCRGDAAVGHRNIGTESAGAADEETGRVELATGGNDRRVEQTKVLDGSVDGGEVQRNRQTTHWAIGGKT